MMFLFLCGMTFCLPFKNKPGSSEATEPRQPAYTEESADAAKTGDSLVVAAEHVREPASAEATAGKAGTISFATQIQPILQTRCNPCHFPGGKMYEKMPFDQVRIILDHPEGILKRINEGEDGRLVRQFIESHAAKN